MGGKHPESASSPSYCSASDRGRGAVAMAAPLEIAEKRRWERKRKRLRDLKLRYPNDAEVEELARLAKVQNLARFGQHIQHIILDAHLNDRSFRNLSTPDVRNALNNIAS